MKTTGEMIEVMTHFANGGEVELAYGSGEWNVVLNPLWDWHACNYRIKQPVDPYAEPKAAAADPTKQIRMKHANTEWSDAGRDWRWNFEPEDYEIRDKPKTKEVKMLAWATARQLIWLVEGVGPGVSAKRVPMQDKVIEVEEV